MTTKQDLLDWVAWDNVMSASRYAGGHTDVMLSIWDPYKVQVVGQYIEDDYQGTEAFAYLFPDGAVAVITDHFGSCSGCDSWEDATDEEAKSMITSMVTSARLFATYEDAVRWAGTVDEDAADYGFRAAAHIDWRCPLSR